MGHLGHRREVFRPQTKRRVRKDIQKALEDREFEKAVNLAAFSYSARPISDDFAISFVATAEAVSLGRELNWSRSTEDLVAAGISIAERKFEARINRRRRSVIIEAIARSVERARREESSRDE